MTKTVKEYMDDASDGRLILPSIQRNYVWEQEQICRLFDSIMCNYPIGHIMLWELDGKSIKEKGLDFYKLLTHYDEMIQEYNEKVENPSPEKSFYGILDGQQRTQALFLGLRGYLKLKIFRARKDNVNSYKEKYLYLNLIGKPTIDDDYNYEFKFIADKELNDEENTNKMWFKVGKILTFSEEPDLESLDEFKSFMEILSSEDVKLARKNINRLYQQLCVNKEVLKLDYIPNDTTYDDILNIFVRTNSGGTVLSKTDLLFSTVVAIWPEARKNIEELLDIINNKGGQSYKFYFSKDFVMRTMLYLLDEPVTLKVKDLKENINIMKQNWDKISNSIQGVIPLLRYAGYSSDNLTSYNAVMPLIYYLYKGGTTDSQNGNNPKEEFKKYLIISQMKKLYGVASNSTLTSVRNALVDENKKLKNKSFNMNDLKDVSIVGERNFYVDDEVVDSWFDENKGDYTFMILSILYPCADIANAVYHQDHMHPESKLMKIEPFKDIRNKLANLQLLSGEENEIKNSTDLEVWIRLHPEEKDKYLPNCSLSIDNYVEFLEKRKELMKAEILNVLKIND